MHSRLHLIVDCIVVDNPKSKLDLDCQSSYSNSNHIQKIQINSQENKILSCIMLQPNKAKLFWSHDFLKMVVKLWVDKEIFFGHRDMFTYKIKTSIFAVVEFFFKKKYMTVIGLSIDFEKWIFIWIVNHIVVMDLDWVNNPKNWIEQQLVTMYCAIMWHQDYRRLTKALWIFDLRQLYSSRGTFIDGSYYIYVSKCFLITFFIVN